MKSKLLVYLFLLILTTLTFSQESENGSNGKFSGYMVGDYYENINHHNPEIVDQHGFWFRRIYFTYDYKISSNFSSRLRLEMQNDGSYEDSEVITPFIKDAYLTYKFGDHKAYFGISSPPTFAVIENIWGYRVVEKTPLDLQRMASSRDFGVSVKGQFDSAGKFKYHAMFGNGAGNKQEIDKGKSFTASFSYWPVKEIVFEIYGDFANRTAEADEADTYMGQAFVGYKKENLHGGIQFSHQTVTAKNNTEGELDLNILSLFLSGNVTSNIKLIGRIDRMFNPNPEGENIAYTPYDNSASFTMFLAGVDINVVDGVSIIPNIKYVKYDENNEGITPKHDTYAWLTMYWKFK